MAILLTTPTWTDGELLSAAKLNLLSEAAGAVGAAVVAPCGIFNVRGVNSTWYMRRRWRYLHVAYSVTVNAENVDVSVNFGTGGGGDYTHGSTVDWQWRTYDLQSVGATTVGEFYAIHVSRSGDDFAFACECIMESESSSPTDTGTYTAAPTWGNLEAVGATKLNALSTCVEGFDGVVIAPSAVALQATDGHTYLMRRRQTDLEIRAVVEGGAELDLYVDATKVVNNATTGTYTVDLSALSIAVGAWYNVRAARLFGVARVSGLRELPDTVTASAPTWAHGENNFLTKINSYATMLDAAAVTLGQVGWQVAALYRPYDHPMWAAYKTKRYLHYMRNGSTQARIVDPSGENDGVGLSRTTSTELFASYDLDTIDWLAPGGLFWVNEADALWLDDEP